MKCAVLCNGPSRTLYTPSESYEWVLGCNIPWTEVDATVVIDFQIIDKWDKNLALIPCSMYAAQRAFQRIKGAKNRLYMKTRLVETFRSERNYHSSGHCAAELAIRKGYTSIDVYGCDSYFSEDTTSYTREHIKNAGPRKGDLRTLHGWRVRWDAMIRKYPHIKIEFIRSKLNDNT